MLNFKAKQLLTKDVGIDLGTATVLVFVEGKGVVLNEPSVVAVDKNTDCIVKIGTDAQAMLGRNPIILRSFVPCGTVSSTATILPKK